MLPRLLRWLGISLICFVILWLIAALFLIINGLKERVELADVAIVLNANYLQKPFVLLESLLHSSPRWIRA
jgi:hypothetical protein